MAHEGVTATDDALKLLSAIRRAAIVELRGQGWSWRQIGDLLGIHRNRAAHLLDP